MFILAQLCAFAFASPAQTGLLRQGGEYRIVSASRPDQIYPAVAIGRDGGMLVWQENGSSGEDYSIRGQRLDASLSGQYDSFQISESGGSHTLPKVALLADGSTLVVWQRQQGAKMDVLARMLSPFGTFVGGEIVVNTVTGEQSNPSIAALSDGGAVVVWAGNGQDANRLGVVGQRLSNQGAKLGNQFLVNQFAANNQRDPSVTALSGGGFVVAWISELQRSDHSVDVYARMFAADGTAVGDEFPVNAVDQMSLTPAVSGRADGGFVVAWMQTGEVKDNNGWDVYRALCSATGQVIVAPELANQDRFGDQYSSRLSPAGLEHALVWTSLGLDGDDEGVYGRFMDADGSLNGSEFLVNTTTASKQLHPAVAADGFGRLLVVWSGFNRPTPTSATRFDLFAQRFDAVRPVPTPGAPYVCALSSDSLSVTWPALLGFEVARYEIVLDGANTFSAPENAFVITGLAAGTGHTVQLRYVLSDGRTSELSPPSTGATWGADLNGDGIPDDWQKLYFGKNSWPDPSVDTDGDGASDLAEFLAGTDPQNASSVLRSQMTREGDYLRFGWTTQPGMVYQVQGSANLVDWVNMGPPRFAVGSTDSVAMERTGAGGWYRVIRVR